MLTVYLTAAGMTTEQLEFRSLGREVNDFLIAWKMNQWFSDRSEDESIAFDRSEDVSMVF